MSPFTVSSYRAKVNAELTVSKAATKKRIACATISFSFSVSLLTLVVVVELDDDNDDDGDCSSLA